MATPEQKTEPVIVEPDRIIEKVYEQGGVPDTGSQDSFEEYLVERMYGPNSDVSEDFEPGSDHTVTDRVRDGWLIRPRAALVATLASTLALSLAGVRMPVINGLTDKLVVDPAGDLIDKLSPKYKREDTPVTLPSEPKKVTYNLGVKGDEQKSGKAEADTVTARELVERAGKIENGEGRSLTSITVAGSASDEWLKKGIRSLGVRDPENSQLSFSRARAIKNTLLRIGRKQDVDLPEIKIAGNESVLGSRELGTLITTINKHGYNSVGEAIRAYNSGEKLPRKLNKLVKSYLGNKRSVVATINYEEADQAVIHSTKAEFEEVDEDHKLPFAFLPIPPIPWYRRRTRNIFDQPPVLPVEPPEQVELELYKEAKKRNGDLVDESWALTRKYQALLREERIQTLSTFEYTDEDGKPQTFRIGFVDHEPTEETMEAISELLKTFSLMSRGKIPERLNMIAVYPSEQTGPQQNPKKIGLGIDEQYGSDTLGIAIPALSLVEMHMPTNPTKADIEKFMGMRWIMAHEIAGHFTDVKDKPVRLTRASTYRRGVRNYTASDPWRSSTTGEYGSVSDRGMVPVQSRQFAIPDQRAENDPTETDEYLVDANSETLAEATSARLSRMAPTSYAEENVRELHSETAAQVTTRIRIPFEEAGVKPDSDWQTEGYLVDAGLLYTFAKRVGSGTNADFLTWTREQLTRGSKLITGRLDRDPVQHGQAETAKNTPYQPDDKRIRIVTDQTE